MSASNAAAKKRRAIIPPNMTETVPNVGGRSYIPGKSQMPPPPSPSSTFAGNQNMNTSQSGFTLPQVIALIDQRLVNLEKNVTEMKNKQPDPTAAAAVNPVELTEIKTQINEQGDFNKEIQENFQIMNDNLNEYDNRFEILVNEIAELKFIVLKLQTYTMDVNKMLLEERPPNNSVFPQLEVVEESTVDISKKEETMVNNLQESVEGAGGYLQESDQTGEFTLSQSTMDENGNLVV
jgi:hypothetical protein